MYWRLINIIINKIIYDTFTSLYNFFLSFLFCCCCCSQNLHLNMQNKFVIWCFFVLSSFGRHKNGKLHELLMMKQIFLQQSWIKWFPQIFIYKRSPVKSCFAYLFYVYVCSTYVWIWIKGQRICVMYINFGQALNFDKILCYIHIFDWNII